MHFVLVLLNDFLNTIRNYLPIESGEREIDLEYGARSSRGGYLVLASDD